jgi:membrane protein
VKFLRRCLHIAYDAFERFNADDGWAIASHLALSALMSFFPFLLILTALAGIFGSAYLADEAARILVETWPEEVSAPMLLEVTAVLASAHSGTLTIGIMLALYFASSGVEGLRIALNRAYSVVDQRPWWLLRLESIGYVLVGAVGLLALSFLVVLAPLIWRTALKYAPWIDPFSEIITFLRFGIASVLLIVALVIVHLWLPAGRRTLRQIAPGVLATLVMWLIAGTVFGRYLADFAFTYARYYAGLASVMIILVFLYLTATIFIYGGELNAASADVDPAPGAKTPEE